MAKKKKDSKTNYVVFSLTEGGAEITEPKSLTIKQIDVLMSALYQLRTRKRR